MKVLMYGNRKEGSTYWDISNPEKEVAGLRRLFQHLDEDWQMFEVEEHTFEEEKEIKELEGLKELLDNNKIPDILLEISKKKVARLAEIQKEKQNNTKQIELAKRARAGDAYAIGKLLRAVQHTDYGEWSIINVANPLE
jgi:pantothenate kinase